VLVIRARKLRRYRLGAAGPARAPARVLSPGSPLKMACGSQAPGYPHAVFSGRPPCATRGLPRRQSCRVGRTFRSAVLDSHRVGRTFQVRHFPGPTQYLTASALRLYAAPPSATAPRAIVVLRLIRPQLSRVVRLTRRSLSEGATRLRQGSERGPSAVGPAAQPERKYLKRITSIAGRNSSRRVARPVLICRQFEVRRRCRLPHPCLAVQGACARIVDPRPEASQPRRR
jgi:hypothetical protein